MWQDMLTPQWRRACLMDFTSAAKRQKASFREDAGCTYVVGKPGEADRAEDVIADERRVPYEEE